MTETYLIDTSALIRFYRRQSDPQWNKVVESGVVGICEPVRLEFLQASGGRTDFLEADNLLRDTFPYYVVPDSAWESADRLQQRLAARSWHQCASPVDLLVAVTAAHHRLTVLHTDRDFETIAQLTEQPTARIT